MELALRMAVCSILATVAGAQEARPAAAEKPTEIARPIAFDKVDRRIGKLPELGTPEPLYGLFLFGRNGERRVWAILDKSTERAEAFDVLHLDRNADGDLGGPGERIEAKRVTRTGAEKERISAVFEVGDFRDPGTGAVHADFTITSTPESVRFKMLWRGDKVTMGVFGPERETYQNFAASPKAAPIIVPGYDRPFQFQHWMCDRLRRDGSTDFKVFVGNRGDRTGAFSCVDDEFFAEGEIVLATLLYRDTAGAQKRHRVKLTERC